MTWVAWILLAAIIVGALIVVTTVRSERGIGAPPDRDELDQLRRRIRELEQQSPQTPPEHRGPEDREQPRIPSRAEENLTAEDRWRLDMLEARLENLEKPEKPGMPERGDHGEADDGDSGDEGDESGDLSSGTTR